MNIFVSGACVTDDEKYLLLVVLRGTARVNALWYAELQPMIESKMSLPPKWCKLCNDFDASYTVSKLGLICFKF